MGTFSTWAALRTSIKDKIATLIAGEPFIAEYRIGTFSRVCRSVSELRELYELTYDLERLDSHVSSGMPVSRGRYRNQ